MIEMDKFEKLAKSALYFLVPANTIMAIGLAIMGFALNSPLPFYGAILVFLSGIALIFVINNAIKKYKSMIEKENK